jgi:hypothetical protein
VGRIGKSLVFGYIITVLPVFTAIAVCGAKALAGLPPDSGLFCVAILVMDFIVAGFIGAI